MQLAPLQFMENVRRHHPRRCIVKIHMLKRIDDTALPAEST